MSQDEDFSKIRSKKRKIEDISNSNEGSEPVSD